MSIDNNQTSSARQYRKPRANLYTVLLLLALIAILLAIWCLYAEMKAYEFEFKGATPAASLPSAADAHATGTPWADRVLAMQSPASSATSRLRRLLQPDD